MAKVVVTKSKLDSLAQHINAKAGTTGAKTIAQMQATVDGISPGVAKETWVLNERPGPRNSTYTIDFTSNGTRYSTLTVSPFIASRLKYGDTLVFGNHGGSGSSWINQAYRKLTFDTPPTGALLTWLQSNATKQPDDTAIQDTKALTITSNGTVSVTPDAPYDALKKVDVTVDVPTGGSVDMRTINITVDGQSVSDIEGWGVDCYYGVDIATLNSGTPSASISVPNQTVFAITVTPDMFVGVSGADEAVQFDIANVSESYSHVNGSNFPDAFTYVCLLNATGEDSSFTLALSLSKNPEFPE